MLLSGLVVLTPIIPIHMFTVMLNHKNPSQNMACGHLATTLDTKEQFTGDVLATKAMAANLWATILVATWFLSTVAATSL